MLCWEEFVELRNLHERGWSVSAIARHLGKDRKTIRRYLTDPNARPRVGSFDGNPWGFSLAVGTGPCVVG
jgi:transposase